MPSSGDASATLVAVQMSELRHRLRNHLQNMTSLIRLEAGRARSDETIRVLEDLGARFETLTGIYISLDDETSRPIELERFVSDLARRVGELYDPLQHHAMTFSIAPLVLPGQRASLLGQIVVELMMNAYRHAFVGRARGKISVTLSREGDEAALVIRDDGPGLRQPDGSRKHLGLSIVGRLARALGGTFSSESRDGLVARVRFPLAPGCATG